MPPSHDIRKRVLYAKYLLSRAKKDQNDKNDLAIAACLLLMHDATELLMLAVTDHLSIGSKWGFMEFWEKVKLKTKKEPSHKRPMNELNEMRVSLKHHGILPRPQSVRDLFPRAEIFCEEVTKEFLDLDFGELSLGDLVADDEVRNALRDAKKALDTGDKKQAFLNVRIAFDKLYCLIASDVALVKKPRGIKVPKVLPNETKNGLLNLQGVVFDLVGTLNTLVLGIDPIRYRFLMVNTPSVSWTLSGRCQAVFMHDYSDVPDDVFHTCYEFVVDVALKASR